MKANLHTRVCDLLNVRYPIFQAGMAAVSCPELAAAVSESGGFGSLASSGYSPESLREEIRKTKSLTSKGFGVNIIVPFFDEEHLQVCLDEGIPVISFHWGLLESYISDIHRSGAKVFQQVCSLEEAVRAADAGVDVIIAQGSEAGGHVATKLTTLAFVPQAMDKIQDIPVLAAGGIVDGRGVAAALMLGADGVWMGTRFVASKECRAHPRYKSRLLEATGEEAIRSTIYDYPWRDAPHRALRNSEIDEWVGKENLRPDGEVIGQTFLGDDPYPVQRFSCIPPTARTTGDIDKMVMYAGQGCGLIKDIKSATEIIEELVSVAQISIGRFISG